MKNLNNIDVFHIKTTDKGTFAYISFQDMENGDPVNNFYNHIRVPMNLRPIQLSSRDNVLVDQSVQNYVDVETKQQEQ
jgi:hypothetical protein